MYKILGGISKTQLTIIPTERVFTYQDIIIETTFQWRIERNKTFNEEEEDDDEDDDDDDDDDDDKSILISAL